MAISPYWEIVSIYLYSLTATKIVTHILKWLLQLPQQVSDNFVREWFYQNVCKPMCRGHMCLWLFVCWLISFPFCLDLSYCLPSPSFFPLVFSFNIHSSNFCLHSISLLWVIFWVFPIWRNLDRFSLFLKFQRVFIITSIPISQCVGYCVVLLFCCFRVHLDSMIDLSVLVQIYTTLHLCQCHTHYVQCCSAPMFDLLTVFATHHKCVKLSPPTSPSAQHVIILVGASSPKTITFVPHPLGLLHTMPSNRTPTASVKQSAPSKSQS